MRNVSASRMPPGTGDARPCLIHLAACLAETHPLCPRGGFNIRMVPVDTSGMLARSVLATLPGYTRDSDRSAVRMRLALKLR
jgi:hypothetical protein